MVTSEDEEEAMAGEEALLPQNIIDRVTFGRRLRALRVMHGFDRVTDFTMVLRGRYGIDVSDRTVYAIERGEQMPHLDFVLAAVAILHPPIHWFAPAIRSDVMEALMSEGSL